MKKEFKVIVGNSTSCLSPVVAGVLVIGPFTTEEEMVSGIKELFGSKAGADITVTPYSGDLKRRYHGSVDYTEVNGMAGHTVYQKVEIVEGTVDELRGSEEGQYSIGELYAMGKLKFKDYPHSGMMYHDPATDTYYDRSGGKLRDPEEYNTNQEAYTPMGDEGFGW